MIKTDEDMSNVNYLKALPDEVQNTLWSCLDIEERKKIHIAYKRMTQLPDFMSNNGEVYGTMLTLAKIFGKLNILEHVNCVNYMCAEENIVLNVYKDLVDNRLDKALSFTHDDVIKIFDDIFWECEILQRSARSVKVKEKEPKFKPGERVVILSDEYGVDYGTILKVYNIYIDVPGEYIYDFQNADLDTAPEDVLKSIDNPDEAEFNIAEFLRQECGTEIYTLVDGYMTLYSISSDGVMKIGENNYDRTGCLIVAPGKISLQYMVFPTEELMVKYNSIPEVAWKVWSYLNNNHD